MPVAMLKKPSYLILDRIIEAALYAVVFFLPISKAMIEIGSTLAIIAWLAKKILARLSHPQMRKSPEGLERKADTAFAIKGNLLRSVEKQERKTCPASWRDHALFSFIAQTDEKSGLAKERLIPDLKINPFYLLFILISLISIIQIPAASLHLGFRGTLKWLEYIAVFFIAQGTFQTPEHHKRLVWILFASVGLVLSSGFYQLYSGHDFLRGFGIGDGRIIRMRASLYSPNSLAAFLYFGITAIIYLRRHYSEEPGLRAFFTFSLTLFIFALLLTFSRGGLFAFIAAFLLYFLASKKHFKKALLYSGILLLLLLMPTPLRFNYFDTLTLKDITIHERLDYWALTWNMIQDHPWLGAGVNMFHQVFPQYQTGRLAQAYAHNSYLQIWSEIGVFGLAMFLLPIFIVFAKVRREIIQNDLKEFLIFQIPLLAFLLQSGLDTHLFSMQTAVLFWIFWGVFTGAVYKKP